MTVAIDIVANSDGRYIAVLYGRGTGAAPTTIHVSWTELASRLLNEAHVVTVPGEAFGTQEHIRLSYAVAHSDIEEGLVRMKSFFAALS